MVVSTINHPIGGTPIYGNPQVNPLILRQATEACVVESCISSAALGENFKVHAGDFTPLEENHPTLDARFANLELLKWNNVTTQHFAASVLRDRNRLVSATFCSQLQAAAWRMPGGLPVNPCWDSFAKLDVSHLPWLWVTFQPLKLGKLKTRHIQIQPMTVYGIEGYLHEQQTISWLCNCL